MKEAIQSGFVNPAALEWTRANYGVSALSVHERAISVLRAQEQDIPSMKLDVNAGAYSYNGVMHLFLGGQSPEFTAPEEGTRLDILYLDGESGELAIQKGTAAVAITDPLELPAVPSGAIPLVAVHLAAEQEAITESDLYDLRAFVGGMGGAWSLIAAAVLTQNVASVTFSSIPQDFVNLYITGVVRTNRAASADSVRMRFNGDSGNNYDWLGVDMTISGYAPTAVRANSSIPVCRCEAASASSQAFSPLRMFVPNYNSTSAYKYAMSDATFTRAAAGANTDLYLTYFGGCWRSTAAITSVTLFPYAGTNIVSGSRFYLWGAK